MWVLGLVVLVDEIDKNIVRGMITPLKNEFGVGDLGISVMLSLALLLNGLVTVPAGYLADRWNRTRAVGHTSSGGRRSALSAPPRCTFPCWCPCDRRWASARRSPSRRRPACSATTTRRPAAAGRSRSSK
jgi:hypothetical protein